jgi:predicted PurR-regulated permease PerM
VNYEQWRLRLVVLATLAAAVWLAEQAVPLLQRFGDLLLLFFLAWLVAFILDPIVNALERGHVPRGLAVLAIYGVLAVLAVLLLVYAGPAMADQAARLGDPLTSLIDALPSRSDVAARLAAAGLPQGLADMLYQPDLWTQQLQASAGGVVQGTLAVAASAVNVIVNLLLMLLISFYWLLDGRRILWDVLRYVPRAYRANMLKVVAQWSASFGGFLRGQLIQALLFAGIVVVVMLIFGLDFVAICATASGVLMLLPMIGPILAIIPPAVVAVFTPDAPVVVIVVILVIAEVVLVNALMPKILSHQMGMPPLLVMAAILGGLRIGGFWGAFLGVPIMGVIYGLALALLKGWKAGESRTVDEAPATD